MDKFFGDFFSITARILYFQIFAFDYSLLTTNYLLIPRRVDRLNNKCIVSVGIDIGFPTKQLIHNP